jgi:hypothetical protein
MKRNCRIVFVALLVLQAAAFYAWQSPVQVIISVYVALNWALMEISI